MKKHSIWMIIGCTVPLLLIFIAPALGLSGNVSILIFVIAMFACHLLMPMHHGNSHSRHRHSNQSKTKEDLK